MKPNTSYSDKIWKVSCDGFVAERLADPLKWRKPRRVLVGELFCESFTNEQIATVFGVMAACSEHTFLVLTKRSKRMREWFEWIACKDPGWEALRCMERAPVALLYPDEYRWPLVNCWLGVSVENQAAADERIPDLLATPAAVRWVSAERLLGLLDLSPWIGERIVEQDQESRRIRVRSSDLGGHGDRHGWPDLEGREATWESLGHANGVGSMSKSSSGTGGQGVSEREGDDRSEKNDCARAPYGLAALQRSDTGRPNYQPQERDQGRQQTGESGTRDRLRATAACDSRSWSRSGRESEWDQKSCSEVDDITSSRDSSGEEIRRTVGGDSYSIRDNLSARVSDLFRQSTISWIVGGCESGPSARPCDVAWLRSLRDQCATACVPFFLRQATEATDGIVAPAGVPPEIIKAVSPFDRTRFTDAITAGPSSKRKRSGVIELPYLDGVQHKAMPK